MIKINRNTGEITGEVNEEKAWELIAKAFMQLQDTEENKEEEQ